MREITAELLIYGDNYFDLAIDSKYICKKCKVEYDTRLECINHKCKG